MITYVMGDATEPWIKGNKVIAHVCNDVGVWGAGFVLAVSKKWPLAEQQYRRWHEDGHNMPGMEDFPFSLGTTQFVPVEHRVNVEAKTNEYTFVANMVAQRDIRRSGDGAPPIRYDALEACLTGVRDLIEHLGSGTVHMPRIGCGLGGGKWEDVEPIIDRTLGDVDVYVYDIR